MVLDVIAKTRQDWIVANVKIEKMPTANHLDTWEPSQIGLRGIIGLADGRCEQYQPFEYNGCGKLGRQIGHVVSDDAAGTVTNECDVLNPGALCRLADCKHFSCCWQYIRKWITGSGAPRKEVGFVAGASRPGARFSLVAWKKFRRPDPEDMDPCQMGRRVEVATIV